MSCLQGNDEDAEDADKKAAKRYFSGDNDVGQRQQQPHSGLEPGEPAPEGVSSSTIVSGLLASRKQDHAVSACMCYIACFLSST